MTAHPPVPTLFDLRLGELVAQGGLCWLVVGVWPAAGEWDGWRRDFGRRRLAWTGKAYRWELAPPVVDHRGEA